MNKPQEAAGASNESEVMNYSYTKNKFSMSDLSEKGVIFEINDVSDAPERLVYNRKEIYERNTNAGIFANKDSYENGCESFEELTTKMTKLTEDGKIKKRILREGYGSALSDEATITVNYNAYLEYHDDPFDSTYIRKKPFTFRLNNSQTLPGLDIAVQSMKLNEKSLFLIHQDYAYGALGCIEQVPPNSTVLFEVEVINCRDSGACVSHPNLCEHEQQSFEQVYMYAHALCSKAKDLFNNKRSYKQAIKEYNLAAKKLESCSLKDYAEQVKQQELLFRVYKNLVIAYTKSEEPRRACINYNKIINMRKETFFQIPVEVYFNHARSLMLLSSYNHAEKQLKEAYRLQPGNACIIKEFIKLDEKRKHSHNLEVAMAKAVCGNTEKNKEECENDQVAKEFRHCITDYCKELNEDAESILYNLPGKLSKLELDFVEKEVVKHGLELRSIKSEGEEKYYVTKLSDTDKNN